MRKLTFILFVTILFVFSCKKETETLDLYYDYFPINIGSWVSYKVDSVAYNDFTGTVDTFSFYVKEFIESHFDDNENRQTKRIERYYKDSLSGQWHIKNVWKANRLAQRVEKVEENIRFIKLVFPIKESEKWDGNAYNIYPAEEYTYKDVHKSLGLNGFSFDSTLTVLQGAETTLFTEKEAKEIYAKNIGCIYLKRKNLSKLADGTIVSGYDYVYQVISWGN